jgi:hypothetical protein
MLQLKIRNVGDIILANQDYLDLYDKMTNSDYRVMISITSQFTGKTKTYLPSTTYTNKERYVNIATWTTRDTAQENLTTGIIQLGTTDYPLGFYDIIIYQNTDNANLDPTGLTTIYEGLMNLSIISGATEPVVYTEYTTNDADTESIYITNTAV